MSLIRMKTEHVEEILHQMDWVIIQMSVKPGKFRTLASQISGAWQGGGAGRYAAELIQIANQMQKLNTDFQLLSTQVRAEINEWEAMDATHGYKVPLPLYSTPMMAGSPTPLTNPSDAGSSPQKFDWLNWTGGSIGGGFSIIGGAATLMKVEDPLGDISPAFSVGFSIVNGVNQGEGWDKAVLSGFLNFGISTLVDDGLYAIPIVGEVYLGYQGVLLAGRVIAGGLEVSGFTSQAAWLENGVDEIDLGTYTQKLSDGITDAALNAGSALAEDLAPNVY